MSELLRGSQLIVVLELIEIPVVIPTPVYNDQRSSGSVLKINEASNLLQKIYTKDANWRELTRRLPKVNLLTVSPADLQILLK